MPLFIVLATLLASQTVIVWALTRSPDDLGGMESPAAGACSRAGLLSRHERCDVPAVNHAMPAVLNQYSVVDLAATQQH